jgi:PKD repeat protein
MRRAWVGRGLLVGAAVACFVALPAASVQAATCVSSAASIVVHLPSGTQTVTAAGLCRLATVDEQYYTRSVPNSDEQASPFISAGVPITAVLQDVGLDPATVTFTGAVRTSDGSWSTLTNADLVHPTFANGLVPVVEVNGDAINYVRPLRPGDADTNANDEIDTDPGVPLQLYAGTGPLLDVTATATPMSAKPGQAISFTATATPASESPSYSWTFSDGATAAGEDVTHAFATAGTYEVTVIARGADGSGGEARPIYPSVSGGATRTPTPTPTPGGGQSSPPSSPKPGPTSGHGNQPSGTPTPRPTPSSSASAPAAAATSTARPTTRRTTGSHGPRHSTAVLDADELPLVHGKLIGKGAVVLSAAGPAVAQTGAAAAGRLSAGWRAAGLVGSIAVIMLLFAAGAARELRWSRRLRSAVKPR